MTLTMDKEEARLFNPQMVFKNMIIDELETPREGVSRTELWGWVKISVKGGKFAFLIESCPIIEDILWVYDKIKKACNSPSIFAHATLLYTFFSKQRSPSDLHKTNVEIEEEANHIELVCEMLNHPFSLPSHIRRSLLIYHAIRKDPKEIRERTIERLCTEEPDFNTARMLEEFDAMQLKYEQMHAHDQGRGGARANSTRSGASNQGAGGGTSDSSTHPCYGFNSEKCCVKKGCRFAHRKMTKEESEASEKRLAEFKAGKNRDSGGASAGQSVPSNSCNKCGLTNHKAKDCKFTGAAVIGRRPTTRRLFVRERRRVNRE